MTPERALINKALWAFRPTTEQGKAVADLALLCERLLAGGGLAPSDEAAIRKEIDDGPTLALLAWADLLEERGEAPAVCVALRTLARQGKRPGMAGRLYRWTTERPEFGAGASWTLPEDVVKTLALRSLDLGGKERGRFASQSAALLAAARVMAARQPVEHAGHDDDSCWPDGGGIVGKCSSCGPVDVTGAEEAGGEIVLRCASCRKSLRYEGVR